LFGNFESKGHYELWDHIKDLQTFLEEAKQNPISLSDMQLIVEQGLILLEMFYVHLPLKRAMHAIDPVQRLRLLKYRLDQMSEENKLDQLDFHSEMIRIFTSLRDLHTNYNLPEPYNDKIAFLPFQIEECFENNQRKYIVSRLAAGLDHPTFKPGVEVTYWNAIPIERAVDLNANLHAGSNTEANHARGIDSLTIRWLVQELPPDEEWVVIGYRSLTGQDLELKQNWLVMLDSKVLPYFPNPSTDVAAIQGIDIGTYMIYQTKKALFVPDALEAQKKIESREILHAESPKGLQTSMPTVFIAKEVKTSYGSYAYIRILTFAVSYEKIFIEEFMSLLNLLPQNGLILDLRNNGGGNIYASERLLQLLTPNHIKPEPTQFISTPLTYELCCRNNDFALWVESLKKAVETGATFSQGFSITPEDLCNDIGQVYYGPVILITDALCYSATDIFAAGFQDNKIGPILGTNGNTGAGGANVWKQNDILSGMNNNRTDDTNFQIKSLPHGAAMRVSLRRTLRVHKHEGMPLEDLGVIPDASRYDSKSTDVHKMTKQDVLDDNIDLINHAASILAKRPIYKISTEISFNGNKLTVKSETENISTLDVYIDDRPQLSTDVQNNLTQFDLNKPIHIPSTIKIEGYKDKTLVAVYRNKIEH